MGYFGKVDTAKTETSKASAKEKVQVAVMGSYDNSGNINNSELKTNLDQVEGIDKSTVPETITDDIYPFSVTVDGHEVTIEKNGRVTVAGETPITPDFDENTFTLGTDESDAKNTDKYGWKVPEYTVKTKEFTTGVWRLFYQDSNYTYLITDECVGSYQPIAYYTTMKKGEELKYQTGADVSTVGQKLSQKISSLFTSSNENTNIRTTAWLTDTSDTGMWSSYKNTDTVFAIGSPTAELFAASYNNRSNKSNPITLGLETYGYTENTGKDWLSVDDNYGIYNKSTTSFWWLASPYGNSSGNELDVDGDDGYFNGGNSHAVRPIVCIPTSVFNSKYTLINA